MVGFTSYPTTLPLFIKGSPEPALGRGVTVSASIIRGLVPASTTLPTEASEPEWEFGNDEEPDGRAGLTEAQLAIADHAIEQLVAENPDLEYLPFEIMAPEARELIVRVLATYPHLRGEQLLKKIYDKATLPKTIALDDWLASDTASGKWGLEMNELRRLITLPSHWVRAYAAMGLFTFFLQIWIRAFQCAGFENCGISFAKALVWAIAWPLLWLALLFGVPPLRDWLF